jgi:predicted component of type VI protein secretion system
MPRTKNVSAPGGGDDEDPPRPYRQVKGKTVYLEQQEGRKKRRLDRVARAAAAAAAAEQIEQGDQLRISSYQIAYRVRRHASCPRSSAPTTPTTATTPPPTSPAPITPAPSTTSAIPTTSTTPVSTAPLALLSAPPIPPARFWERDETEVRPLAADPRLFDLQRATAARVRRFRYVPVESWLPAQRDPAAADPFSTRIQESFYRA